MTGQQVSDQLSDDALERAAAWHVRLQSDDVTGSDWTEFTAWLEGDAANRIAYDRVEDLYAELDQSEEVLQSLAPHWMAAPKVSILDRFRGKATVSAYPLAGGGALLAASLLLAIGIYNYQIDESLQIYSTGKGEMKTVTLADGSNVDMGAASKIEVAFDTTERHIRLESGEAAFKVAKDSARPFVVTAGNRDIRDIGTVFNVRRSNGQTAVTVAEGQVAVSANGTHTQLAPITPVHLSPGEQLVYNEGTAEGKVSQVDPDAVLAWRQGYLAYEGAPLELVVSDLNRYFAQPILIHDADLAQRQFSGVLRIEDEKAAIHRLAEILSLIAETDADGNLVLKVGKEGN